MKIKVAVFQHDSFFSRGKKITQVIEFPDEYFPAVWSLKINEAKVRVIATFEAQNKQDIRCEITIDAKPAKVEYIEISDEETGIVLVRGEF